MHLLLFNFLRRRSKFQRRKEGKLSHVYNRDGEGLRGGKLQQCCCCYGTAAVQSFSFICVFLLVFQAGSSYDIPKKLQEVFGPLRAADEIIDEGHIIGKVRQPVSVVCHPCECRYIRTTVQVFHIILLHHRKVIVSVSSVTLSLRTLQVYNSSPPFWCTFPVHQRLCTHAP